MRMPFKSFQPRVIQSRPAGDFLDDFASRRASRSRMPSAALHVDASHDAMAQRRRVITFALALLERRLPSAVIASPRPNTTMLDTAASLTLSAHRRIAAIACHHSQCIFTLRRCKADYTSSRDLKVSLRAGIFLYCRRFTTISFAADDRSPQARVSHAGRYQLLTHTDYYFSRSPPHSEKCRDGHAYVIEWARHIKLAASCYFA